MYNKYDIKAEIYRYVYVPRANSQMNLTRKSKSNAGREEHPWNVIDGDESSPWEFLVG